MGQTERVALKYIHYHIENRQLVGSCYTTQELSLVLCDNLKEQNGAGGRFKREVTYV